MKKEAIPEESKAEILQESLNLLQDSTHLGSISPPHPNVPTENVPSIWDEGLVIISTD